MPATMFLRRLAICAALIHAMACSADDSQQNSADDGGADPATDAVSDGGGDDGAAFDSDDGGVDVPPDSGPTEDATGDEDALDDGQGSCAGQADGTPCDDGLACSHGDACQAGECKADLKECGCQSDADCPDDGDLCNGVTFCSLAGDVGTCVVNPGSIVTCNTAGDTQCRQAQCQPATGVCAPVELPFGATCSDDVVCSVGDVCDGKGECAPGEWLCCKNNADCLAKDDGDLCNGIPYCDKAAGKCAPNPSTVVKCAVVDDTACRVNQCQPKTGGCAMVVVHQGLACTDNNPCTTGDTCKDGLCEPGASTCPCTTNADCAAQDDGDLCNGTMFCNKQLGQCQANPATTVTCPTVDDTACSKRVCAPKTGTCTTKPTAAGSPCDADGSVCTAGDACDGKGSCAVGTSVCECVTNGDCAAYEDGNLCNGTLFCNKGATSSGCELNPATVKSCPSVDDTACTRNQCDPKSGLCGFVHMPAGAPCDDGAPCTAGDGCDGNGACAAGVNECGCKGDGDCALFDDGDACTGVWHCVDVLAGGKATKGCALDLASLVTCTDDGNPCTTVACAPTTGKCVAKALGGAACDADGSVCTADDACSGATCTAGPAKACDDGNPCTDDGCEPKSGCTTAHNTAACDDGNACSIGDACASAACMPGTATVCDDGNACTDDACDPQKGCVAAANKASCNDGDICTIGDVCAGGGCTAGSTKQVCNDGNVCTDDACDPASGCTQTANDADCSDGNACSTADTCDAGVCAPGTPLKCDDSDVCSDDACHYKDGCTYVAKTGPCDDGDACRTGDTCKNGKCAPGATVKDCGAGICGQGGVCGIAALGVRADYDGTCALLSGGKVACWGGFWGDGQSPQEAGAALAKPAAFSSLDGAVDIEIGSHHACALKADKTVVCWGDGQHGVLGDGKTSGLVKTPAVVPGINDAIALRVGDKSTCALHAGGAVSCWGANDGARIGSGDDKTVIIASPAGVQGLKDATAIAVGGEQACAVRQGGTAVCWGLNSNGSVGDGTASKRAAPVAVKGGLTNVAEIVAGGATTCARTTTGAVYCWGRNNSGQVGIGSTGDSQPSPQKVPGLSGITALAAAFDNFCALGSDKKLACWGANGNGEVGDGTSIRRPAPVTVAGLEAVTAIDGGRKHFCARLQDSSLRCWGFNRQAQLGDGVHGGGARKPGRYADIDKVQSVGNGDVRTCAARTDGSVWCWGNNSGTALATAAPESTVTRPSKVPELAGIVAVATGFSNGLALDDKGALWVWGSGHNGALGTGNTASVAKPKKLTAPTAVVAIAASYQHACAVDGDGAAWCWGDNAKGQVTGTAGAKELAPVKVAAVVGATAVATGVDLTCALAAGKVVCWGAPESAGNPSSLTDVVSISAGTEHACAVTGDGKAWCWGRNGSGQLGNDDKTVGKSSTPVAVKGVTDAKQVFAGKSMACVLHAAGDVSCWGQNSSGEVGDGTTDVRRAPVKLQNLPKTKALAIGERTTKAVLSDGRLQVWGNNGYGQFGDGSLFAHTPQVVVAP